MVKLRLADVKVALENAMAVTRGDEVDVKWSQGQQRELGKWPSIFPLIIASCTLQTTGVGMMCTN